MQSIIQYFILLPLIGFIISIIIPRKNEKLISNSVIYIVGLHFISFVVFLGYWFFNGHTTIDFKNIVIYKTTDYEFFIDFFFDKTTVVYMLVGSFLTFFKRVRLRENSA